MCAFMVTLVKNWMTWDAAEEEEVPVLGGFGGRLQLRSCASTPTPNLSIGKPRYRMVENTGQV